MFWFGRIFVAFLRHWSLAEENDFFQLLLGLFINNVWTLLLLPETPVYCEDSLAQLIPKIEHHLKTFPQNLAVKNELLRVEIVIFFSITLTSKSTSNPFKLLPFILLCTQWAFQLYSLNNVKEMKRHFNFKHFLSIQFIIAIK